VLSAAASAEAAPVLNIAGRPVTFEVNRGQASAEIEFVARGSGYQVHLGGAEASLLLRPSRPTSREPRRLPVGGLDTARTTLRMAFAAARRDARPVAEQPAGHVHYAIGRDPSRWLRGIPAHGRVRYPGIYPRIDVVYHGNARQLEYDLVVHPGGDPGVIVVTIDGLLGDTRLDRASGDLVLSTRAGEVRLRRPLAYQAIGGGHRPVDARYVVHGLRPQPSGEVVAEIGFDLGPWDPDHPLVIDPVVDHATYLGGSGADTATSVAVDASGNAYVAGYTDSLDVPGAPGAGSRRASLDAFVVKLDPTGAAAFTVYLGGSGDDGAMGVAVDAAGHVYLAGFTGSTDFPVVGAFQGDRGSTDAFVAKLGPAGTPLLYSTYLGGSDTDVALAVAVNDAGHAHVTGYAASADFPRLRQVQGTRPLTNAFATRLDTTRTGIASLVYSTGLGGDGEDEGHGIALDAAGNAYVVGWTDSTNFPRVNGYSGDRAGRDGFLTVVPPDAGALLYSTYIGGVGTDRAFGVAVDVRGRAWVTGSTDSDNFPTTPGAYQRGPAGGLDAFVTVLDPTLVGLPSLVASTLYGGSGNDAGLAIALDAGGRALVAGTTRSAGLPTRNALHGRRGGLDALLVHLDPFAPAASALRFASHLGGSGDDEGVAIAVGTTGAAYVVGTTSSPDFPTHRALASVPGGTEDGFLVKLSGLDEAGMDLAVTAVTVPFGAGGETTFPVETTVASLGPAAAPASTLRLFLSVDATLDAADIPLRARAVPALPAGATSSASTTVDLPAGLANGTYRILAMADPGDAQEAGTENNVRASARLAVGADLVVTSIVAPAAGAAGGNVVIDTVVSNQGRPAEAASTLELYLSADAALDGADVLLGNRAVAALAAGASSHAGTTVTIPVGTAPGRYRIVARADADRDVAEADETNNTAASDPLVLGPNLVVTDLDVPTAVTPGTHVAVSDTVQNQGAGAAGPSQTRFYLSSDTTLDAADEWVTSRSVSPLAPGASSPGTTLVAIPGSISQPFYILANANGSGAFAESHAGDNVRASSLIRPGGDLAAWVELPSGSERAAPGGTVSVKEFTKNVGTLPAPATTTRIYLSRDTALDPGDRPLASRSIGPLAPGAVDSSLTSVTIPTDVAGGAWFVLIEADAGGVFPESDETNNFTPPARRIRIGADLIMGLDVPGSAAWNAIGATITVASVTRNNSPVRASPSVTRFHLSADADLDPADLLLGERAVPALAPFTEHRESAPLTFPPTVAGRFHVIALANATGDAAEVDTTNNTASSARIAIGPDLTITLDLPGAFTTVRPGATITVFDVVHNPTPIPAGASVTRFYLSTDATLGPGDILLGARTLPPLAPNTHGAGSTELTLPAATAGTYRLLARADAADAVLEVDESNNLAPPRRLTIGTDLTAWVALPAGSSRVAPGDTFSVEVHTKNLGGLPARATTTRVFLSADSTLDAGDLPLGDHAVDRLTAGAEDVALLSLAIPAGVAAGRHHVLVEADAAGVLAETDETNNFTPPARPILVGADLIVSLDVPGSAAWNAVGATITAANVVSNNSSVRAGPSVTRFYLSADAVLDPTDLLLGQRAVPALAPFTEHGESTSLTFPPGVAGRFHVIARANATGAAAEADTTNNTSPSARIAIGTDLTAWVALAPGSGRVASGGTLAVEVHTKNLGGLAARATTTRVFLSADPTLDAGDRPLGDHPVDRLPAGAEDVALLPLAIPSDVAGGRYHVLVKADATGALPEADETNNFTPPARPILVGVDLVVFLDVAGDSSAVATGATLSVADQTRNDGAGRVGPSTTSFYLSADRTLDAGDVLLGSRSVPALRRGQVSTAVNALPLPAGVVGTFFVLARADAGDEVGEVSNANNVRASKPIAIGPDLTIRGITAPARAAGGSVAFVSDVTKNRGASPVGASMTGIYLSADGTLGAGARLVALRPVPALGPGDRHEATTAVIVPGNVPPGTYRVVVAADGPGEIEEAGEANNRSGQAIEVLADLSVATLRAPSRASAGATIAITDTTRNIGAPAPATRTAVFLSADRERGDGDILLGVRAVPALGHDEDSQGTLEVTLPPTLAAGTWFLIARADRGNRVDEFSESNNASARAITIGPAP
jgi:subtilase family serine protease